MAELGDIEQGGLLDPLPEDRLRNVNLSTVQEESSLEEGGIGLSMSSKDLPNSTRRQEESASQASENDRSLLRGPSNLSSIDSQDDPEDDTEYSALSESGYDNSETETSNNGGSSVLDVESEEGRRVQFPQGKLRSSSNRGLIRMKSRHDIEQNSTRSSQGKHVQIRHMDTATAMDERARRRQRWKKSLSNWFKGSGEDDDEEDNEGMKISMHGRLMVQPSRRAVFKTLRTDSSGSLKGGEDEEDEEEKKRAETQYRLTTIQKKRTRKRQNTTIPGMYEDLTSGEYTECCPCPNFMNSDRVMSKFLHWSFRSPFVAVFGIAAIGWFALTLVFAILIYILGEIQPDCIGGVDFANSTDPFSDAYQLSWTTFSTVGYGLIYPATSADRTSIHRCTLITILTTFEAFVGVLFASLCAALMFAKVARAQSFAQVSFSHPMVIRYGTALTTPDGNDEDDDDDEGLSQDKKSKSKDPLGLRIPCPVLEFRISNRLSTLQGGEIIDATLNMVAIIDVAQADPALTARNVRRKKGKKRRGPTRNNKRSNMRYQRDDIQLEPTLREDEVTLPEEEAASTHSPSSGPDLPPAMSFPKPDIASRQRSVAEQDVQFPHRGPAPSIKRRRTVVRTNAEPAQEHHSQSRHHGHGQGHGRHHRHHMDPRLAARRNDAQHPSMSMAGHGSAPRRSSLASSILHFGRRTERQVSSGSVFFQQHLHRISMRDRKNQAFEEDPTGKFLAKKMLSKLEVESPDHPFFRRIWLVRHTLDVHSLLLKPHVREMLRRNRGYWPKELNNYESIRASIEFDQILVSLSGTSNADANSVYAQHVYHMVDVNVGYRFVNALYRCPKDGTLRVDQTLINDVMEQAGGGGEPLNDFDDNNFQDILVL